MDTFHRVDASRRGKKMPNSSRDKNKDAHRSRGGGKAWLLCDPIADPIYKREGAGAVRRI